MRDFVKPLFGSRPRTPIQDRHLIAQAAEARLRAMTDSTMNNPARSNNDNGSWCTVASYTTNSARSDNTNYNSANTNYNSANSTRFGTAANGTSYNSVMTGSAASSTNYNSVPTNSAISEYNSANSTCYGTAASTSYMYTIYSTSYIH